MFIVHFVFSVYSPSIITLIPHCKTKLYSQVRVVLEPEMLVVPEDVAGLESVHGVEVLAPRSSSKSSISEVWI